MKISANTATVTAMTPNKAPHTKSSETICLATTRTCTSNSSFYETLRAETASCCPLCGFQILAANTDGGSEFITPAIPSIADTSPYPKNNNIPEDTHDDPSLSLWLRSSVVKQQEPLIHGCNITDPPALLATEITGATTGHQADTKQTTLPAGACWICRQAATKAAKERQVEEDRKLAVSLSAISLNEQQERSTGIYAPSHHSSNGVNFNSCSIPTSYGDHIQQAGSLSDQGLCIGNAYNKSRDQGTLSQEWLEGGQELTSTELKPAARAWQVEEDKPCDQNHGRGYNTIYRKNAPVNQECDMDCDKKNVPVDADTGVYIGEYNILGQRHGSRGELIWDSGDRYVGTFKNGMRSGQGTFFFRDGSKFTGDWKENLIHGFGERKFANGDVYVGQYHKGQRSGGPNWKYKFANGDLYVGGWEADQFHGFGRYFYADGSVLEGHFVHGVKQGKFKRQLPTEDLDILRFEDDRPVGQGVRWNPKRTKTWLLEPRVTHGDKNTTTKNTTSDTLISRKKNYRRAARIMVRGIGSLTRRSRQRNSVDDLPSSVGASDNIKARSDEGKHTHCIPFNSSAPSVTSAPSSSVPLENLVPITPQESTKHIVKKSARIPISQAVSIGYDCEIGTETRVLPVSTNHSDHCFKTRNCGTSNGDGCEYFGRQQK